MADTIVPIAITAEDKTAKGAKSAEKRLGQMGSRVSKDAGKERAVSDRMVSQSARGLLRTFGEVEKAGAKVFGGRSISSGITTRLSGITEAASAVGSGLGEASAAGGLMSSALGAVGVAAAATVGVLAAAAYGAFKLASGWASGAAAIGRTAEILGVSTKALQEFTAAGERAGLDKSTAAGALGGLNQSLNDARYGRNNDVIQVLGRLGLKLKLNQDGTVDTAAMLPEIADALKKQNSSGRRTAGRILGISEAALPAFTQGSAALTADMSDADKHANILNDEEIQRGRRIARKGTMVSQLGERGLGAAGSAAASVAETGYDLALKGGQAIADGTSNFAQTVHKEFAPAAQTIGRAANKIEQAAERIGSRIGLGGSLPSRASIISYAQDGARKYGVPASITLAQYHVESSDGKRMPLGSNNPFGIKARTGEDYVIARTREEDKNGKSYYINAKFRKFNSIEQAFDEHGKLISTGRAYKKARASGQNADGFLDGLGAYASDHVYVNTLRNTIRQKNLKQYDIGANPSAPIPVKVEVHLVGGQRGDKTKVTAGHPTAPAISHAMVP